MQAVERLVAEHNLIERVLNLLERVVARLEAGQPIPDRFPAWAARFFQQFADHCHHAKEEDVFFPVLRERGIPEQGGPIGVMLHEHTLGRTCVNAMLRASQSQPVDARTFAAAAREYIPLLRQHIFKENNVLFRMAEQVLSASDDQDISTRFSQVEVDRGQTGWHAAFAAETADWEASGQ
jgi:hemerythrin-like domain-containing protein